MQGNEARHFTTLLYMMTGLILGKHCHLPAIAGKVPVQSKRESLVIRFKRLLQNKNVNASIYFLPFLEKLLPTLTQNTVRLIFDGSVVGRNSACLMASIVYQNRSIPIAWLTAEGRKGHFTEDAHIQLLKLVKSILPAEAEVVVIGDGEFDGVEFLKAIEVYNWSFVVRTAKNAHLRKKNKRVSLPSKLKENECKHLMNVKFTKSHYGPVMALAWRMKDNSKPIYLISNCQSPLEAKKYYKHRQKIETLFSDLKTKGFNLHKSHISDLKRLGNLMIAVCLAYIWLVLLGEHALNTGINRIFHRTERCDLSLLQLGFRFIEYMLNISIPIPKLDLLELK